MFRGCELRIQSWGFGVISGWRASGFEVQGLG